MIWLVALISVFAIQTYQYGWGYLLLLGVIAATLFLGVQSANAIARKIDRHFEDKRLTRARVVRRW